MCGIVGVVRLTPPGPVGGDLLRRMRDTMTHRGPDDEGLYVSGTVGLGHRRLSIIDLSGGHQPMGNAEGTLWVTFNGEIYNFRDLRALLESKGYAFRTKSDTEVILHAYAEFGERCVERFRGMFAFGLWDQPRRRLLLARDRLGIKPLYYTVAAGAFLFASEIKALLQFPGVRREVDPVALGAYLRLRYVPGPRTMFRGIWKLQPGHLLTLREGRISTRAYWDLPMEPPEPAPDPEGEFRERLAESVRLRLLSDVPLGVFLSGGIDSSAVTALMASMVDEPVQTFSVGYPDGGPGSEVTEFAFARMVAERFGTRHRELDLDPGAFWAALPRLLWHFDEPVADPAAVPLYFLSRYVREFVTVVLSGEGGDELLAGYAVYRKMLALDRLRRVPGARLAGCLLAPASSRKLRRYLAWLERPLPERYRGVSALFVGDEPERLLRPELRGAGHDDEVASGYLDRVAGLDPLSRMLYLDLKVWLPDDLLVKADKMTMATAVELRVPFLDHELVEWAWRLPSREKLHRGVGKRLLRRAMAGRLPAPILSRSKLGFPVPIRSWLREGLHRSARELLLGPDGPRVFDPAEVEGLLRAHERGAEDLSGEIYALAVFALWHRLFIESPPTAAPPPPPTMEGSRRAP